MRRRGAVFGPVARSRRPARGSGSTRTRHLVPDIRRLRARRGRLHRHDRPGGISHVRQLPRHRGEPVPDVRPRATNRRPDHGDAGAAAPPAAAQWSEGTSDVRVQSRGRLPCVLGRRMGEAVDKQAEIARDRLDWDAAPWQSCLGDRRNEMARRRKDASQDADSAGAAACDEGKGPVGMERRAGSRRSSTPPAAQGHHLVGHREVSDQMAFANATITEDSAMNTASPAACQRVTSRRQPPTPPSSYTTRGDTTAGGPGTADRARPLVLGAAHLPALRACVPRRCCGA